MKIVILDGYTENPGDLSWDGLRAFGEVTVYDRTPYETAEIIRRIGDAEIVITNKTPLCREVLDACPAIRFIAVLATGYNVVDVKAAREKGIPVSNVPAYGTASVAQYAIALLLEITSRVAHHSEAVHAGRWEHADDWTFWDYPLIELAGKTMGIVGFGRIGQTTGRIAKALGMNILVYTRTPKDFGPGTKNVSLEELLKESDYVTLHCPLTPQTKHIINGETLQLMKPTACLINASRGALVDEPALIKALQEGHLAGAGLDVQETEPPLADNPLYDMPNVILTPHMGWKGLETRRRLVQVLADNIAAYAKGEKLNIVS